MSRYCWGRFYFAYCRNRRADHLPLGAIIYRESGLFKSRVLHRQIWWFYSFSVCFPWCSRHFCIFYVFLRFLYVIAHFLYMFVHWPDARAKSSLCSDMRLSEEQYMRQWLFFSHCVSLYCTVPPHLPLFTNMQFRRASICFFLLRGLTARVPVHSSPEIASQTCWDRREWQNR